MEAVLSFYKGLLLAPEPLHSVWAFLAAFIALVVFPCVPAVWITAAIYRAFSRGHLGAPFTVRLAWGWGAVFLMALFVAHGIALTLLDRMPDWTAACPEAAVVIAAGLVLALGNWLAMRNDLKESQKVLFAARAI
jgi:hypothetical protein